MADQWRPSTGLELVISNPKLKLMDQVREVLRNRILDVVCCKPG
jgi:hypothetical protein